MSLLDITFLKRGSDYPKRPINQNYTLDMSAQERHTDGLESVTIVLKKHFYQIAKIKIKFILSTNT